MTQIPLPPGVSEALWEAYSLEAYGRVLTGKFKHWCTDIDKGNSDEPFDETCDGWPCDCFDEQTQSLR